MVCNVKSVGVFDSLEMSLSFWAGRSTLLHQEPFELRQMHGPGIPGSNPDMPYAQACRHQRVGKTGVRHLIRISHFGRPFLNSFGTCYCLHLTGWFSPHKGEAEVRNWILDMEEMSCQFFSSVVHSLVALWQINSISWEAVVAFFGCKPLLYFPAYWTLVARPTSLLQYYFCAISDSQVMFWELAT